MHEHRTIPQRLNDLESMNADIIAALADQAQRLDKLEAAQPAPKPAPKGGA